MGTSNLYKGPSGNSLLPDGYEASTDDTPKSDAGNDDEEESSNGGKPQDEQGQEDQNDEDQQSQSSSVSTLAGNYWTGAKQNFHKASRSTSTSPKSVAKSYVKALGGARAASRQARAAKSISHSIAYYFYGSLSEFKKKLEAAGIQFRDRSTSEVLEEIYQKIVPPADILDNSIAERALAKTFSELFSNDQYKDKDIDAINHISLLLFLIERFSANFIFERMIDQISHITLSKERISAYVKIEEEMKLYIDGIAHQVVPNIVHDGMNDKELKANINGIFDECYQLMEEVVQ